MDSATARRARRAKPNRQCGAAGKPLRHLERIAYHEAGHAVAHYLLRIPFRSVTIKPTEDSDGCVAGAGLGEGLFDALEMQQCDDRQRLRVEKHIMVFMAGPAAEAIAGGRWPKTCRWSSGDGTDYGMAWGFAYRTIGEHGDFEEANAFFEWLRLRVKWMLVYPPYWAAVAALAKALLEGSGTITSRYARRIIREAILGEVERRSAECDRN